MKMAAHPAEVVRTCRFPFFPTMFKSATPATRNGDEFKLPKTSSMIIILTANMLLQVSDMRVLSGCSFLNYPPTGFFLHHCLLLQRIREALGWRLYFLRHCYRHSDRILWVGSDTTDEI